MNQAKIITLDPKDWKRFKELRLDALSDDPDSFGSTYQETINQPDSYWKDKLDSKTFVFAEVNGVLVSMAAVLYENDDDGVLTAYIVGVYTRPEYRKNGLSKAVLKKLINIIEQDGRVDKIELNVNKDAKSAIKLYEKIGFKKGKPIPDYVRSDGRSFPHYLMYLESPLLNKVE